MDSDATLSLQPSVLVVDDTPANLVAMRALLVRLGVEIVEATSGLEALELARARTFAVALIDVQMPNMDGFELAKRLRDLPECKELPIVFVTAIHRDERYVREGYATGAADYLTKPLDPDVVVARVRAFVDLFRQRERLRALDVGRRTRERDQALAELASLVERERAARHDAEIANAAKDDFIALASHELRTPLTAVLGWIVLAKRTPPGPDHARALDVVERNARALAALVEDLLDMSRSMAGKLRLQMCDVALDDSVAGAVTALGPAAAQKGVYVDVRAQPVVIRADPKRLHQIITNLLSNSIKFTPPGGQIHVTADRLGAGVEVAVTDTGEGIAAELLPKLFEPFRQFCTCNVVGPIQLDGGDDIWYCGHPYDPSCPAVRPRVGSACSSPALHCSYDVCGAPSGLAVDCSAATSTWVTSAGEICSGGS